MKLYGQLQPKISLAGSVVVGIFIKSSQYRIRGKGVSQVIGPYMPVLLQT